MNAFERMISRLNQKLKGIAYKVHWQGCYFNNEDLYQEALLHLWKEYNSGNILGKTDSYILQGCYFHLKNYMRTTLDKVRPVSLDEPCGPDHAGLLDSFRASVTGASDDYISSLNSRMLVEAIYNNGLSDKEKQLLPLFAEGLSTREIGRRAGISHVRVIKMRRQIEKKCRKHLD
ncbi:MAG TPA: sigma-70 family RNA polymerase sigma factor [Candidatus Omnitrophota bacterium]|nr:sigma-70 family RNA polymerase sigma factor [Candidatus Omnitrophota bacterium]